MSNITSGYRSGLNVTSMNFWFPIIKDRGIPVPKTNIILHKEEFGWYKYLDEPLSEDDKNILFSAAEEIGYPLFLRSDLNSGKHQFKDTCYVHDKDALLSCLYGVIEDNAVKDQPMTSIALREYIEPAWEFKAFKGLPIAPERRYFVSWGEVVCHHPYWVQDAIEFYDGQRPPRNWKELLAEMNTESYQEVMQLTGYALKVANTFLKMELSVDFMKARRNGGEWILIDMASGIQSWHPPCLIVDKATAKEQ